VNYTTNEIVSSPSLKVLMLLCKDFPQAMYMAVRVLKNQVPQLWERVQGGLAARHRESLESFCRAIRHLQHPEDQLKNLGPVADLEETHEETMQEILEDFGPDAARATETGEYRKVVIKKWETAHNLSSLLKEKNLKVLFKNLANIGRVYSEDLHKHMRAGKLPLGVLSATLRDLEGNTPDAATLTVPGQHMTSTHSGSEEDAPKLASCDPELLVMCALLRPKRLIMRGSDGKEYWWLVKGGEDLRQVTTDSVINRTLLI
jgi:hypothetical protein